MSEIAAIFMVLVFMVTIGCKSSVKINTIPAGAKVYIDGEYRGETPYVQTDSKSFLSNTTLRLTKEGYTDFTTPLVKDQFSATACCGGVLFLVPFLWIMDYSPEKTYEMKAIENK
jgi:hypothetical protein